MATQNSSILGLFTSPEQYLLNQQQAQMEQARAFASQDPMQRAVASQYFAGGQLGRALGGEDPMLKLQSQRRAFIQQVNMADPNSLRQAIQASANDPEMSAFLLGKYKELTGIQKEQSVIEKNKAWEASKTDSEKKRTLLADVEQRLSEGQQVDPTELNRAKLAWAQETKPKQFQQPTGEIVTVPGVDVNLFPNLNKTLTSGGATGGPKVAGVIETPASIEAKQKGIDAATSAISNIDDSLNAVKGIRDLRAGSISTNPWLAGFMKDYPTAARAQDNLVRTITAGKVIDTIAEMKQQSKTGATGFGALNGRELDQLEAKARRLDPQSPTFEADLKYIEDKLIDSKNKIQSDLSKKKEKAAPYTGGLNPQGEQGRIAILQDELKKAQAAGRKADADGIARELGLMGVKVNPAAPTAPTTSKLTFEQKVQRTMAANPGASRAAVEAQLRAAGHQ